MTLPKGKEECAYRRQLLGMPPPETPAATVPADYRDRYEALTSISLRDCPVCHDGHMRIIEHVPGAAGRLQILDSS